MSLYRLESITRAGAPVHEEGTFFTRYTTLKLHDDRRGLERTDVAAVGDVGVARVVSTGHDIGVEEAECVTLLLPQQGALRCATPGGSFAAKARGALLFWPNIRETRVERAGAHIFRAAALRFTPKVLALVASRLDEQLGRRLSGTGLSLALDPDRDRGIAMLSAYVGALLDELDREGSLLSRSTARERAESQVLETLIEVLQSLGALPEPAAVVDATAHRRVRRAEEYMRAHYGAITSITEVAQATGLGMRALQLAFQSVRDESPRKTLWSIRLEAARARLSLPDDGASVSTVALDCGFTHLGRFSTSYRLRFGETPSETLKRARDAA